MEENPVLAWGLRERKEIKAAEAALDERKKTVNGFIAAEMTKLGVKAYIGEGGDSLVCKAGGTSKSLNKDKMITNFLEAGIAADTVNTCITKATEDKPRAGSIDFLERKEKEEPGQEKANAVPV